MTVGEPEINLNTWGLRYVRKARKEEPSDLSAFGDTTPVLGDRSSDFKPSDYSSGGKGSPVGSKTETLAQPRPDEEQVSWFGGGATTGKKPEPNVCIFIRGVIVAISPWSYAYFPFVKDGHDIGSQPIISISLPPLSC